MNSLAMLFLFIPAVFGAAALVMGLALAAVATGVSESFEERWEASPPTGPAAIPMGERTTRPKAA